MKDPILVSEFVSLAKDYFELNKTLVNFVRSCTIVIKRKGKLVATAFFKANRLVRIRFYHPTKFNEVDAVSQVLLLSLILTHEKDSMTVEEARNLLLEALVEDSSGANVLSFLLDRFSPFVNPRINFLYEGRINENI